MTLTRTLAAALLAAGALASHAALAQGYAGVAAGNAKADIDCAGTTSCDDSDSGFKLFGGYMFTPNLGAEAGYYDLGKARAAGTDVTLGDFTGSFRATGFGVFAVAAAPLGDAAVFAKLGFASTKVKVRATSSVFGAGSDSDSNTNVAWGLGASYQFTPSLGVRAEFERFRPEYEGEKTDLDLISVGLVYRF